MTEYLVNDTDMTAVADAIRTKSGTSDALVFPDGFVSAVQAIQAGSGGDDGSFKAVIERTAVKPLLPSNLTSIGNYTFASCTNLALTSLPDGLTGTGTDAFSSCTKLALTSLPSGFTKIMQNAFGGCTNIALTSLPDGVTSIGQYAFKNCTGLAITSLPEGVTSIGQYAFQNCTGLTSITFRGTPTGTIYSNAFQNCTNLTTINVPWAEGAVANAPWGATNATINYNYAAEG